MKSAQACNLHLHLAPAICTLVLSYRTPGRTPLRPPTPLRDQCPARPSLTVSRSRAQRTRRTRRAQRAAGRMRTHALSLPPGSGQKTAGLEFEELAPAQQALAAAGLVVFSRVEPTHKSKLVELLKVQVRVLWALWVLHGSRYCGQGLHMEHAYACV